MRQQSAVWGLVLFLLAQSCPAAEIVIPPLQEPAEAATLPDWVLAFPPSGFDFERKIVYRGKSEIWSEAEILNWARAQGFAASSDSATGGWQYQRGLIFYPPGLGFVLYTPLNDLGEREAYGWSLLLDLGVLKPSLKSEQLSSDFRHYENILRYEIYINKIFIQTIEIGYGRTSASPLKINIPFVRNPEGKVVVEIKLANHPANFGILYDAYLTRD